MRRALQEDIGEGDVTTASTVDAALPARGRFVAKCDCVLAGLDVAVETFRQLDPAIRFTPIKRDGDRCAPGDVIGELAGPARALLTGERTALNFLQRLSGIATTARRFVDAGRGRIVILDTRKTTPLLRTLEKYAVRTGGAANHRFGLFDAILIKDNHIRLAGGVTAAIQRARHDRPAWRIEVEAQTLAEVDEAAAAGADTILVDNMTTAEIRDAVARTNGRATVEVSGGVTLDSIPALAETGADSVSVGALTHSAPAADISFDIEPR